MWILEFGPDASGSELEFILFVHSWLKRLSVLCFQLSVYSKSEFSFHPFTRLPASHSPLPATSCQLRAISNQPFLVNSYKSNIKNHKSLIKKAPPFPKRLFNYRRRSLSFNHAQGFHYFSLCYNHVVYTRWVVIS